MKLLFPLLAAAPFVAMSLTQSGQAPAPAAIDKFFVSIRNDDLPGLRSLIKDSGVKLSDASGNSPLMYAALDGSPECMRLLLDSGADPNQANGDSVTPLMWCAGDLGKVKMLVEHGAQVKAKSKGGHTPLEMAAFYDGSGDTVKYLLDNGAEVDATDELGDSALVYAAGSNSLAAAKLLLDRHADVNVTDKAGFNALLNASANGYNNEAMVRLLIAHGAKVNAATNAPGPSVMNGPLKLARLTPLHLAATTSYGAVKALVDAGADVNATDVRDASPLVFAVTSDHADPRVVKLLLDHGAKKDQAPVWAERYNNAAVLSLLGENPGSLSAMTQMAPDAGPFEPEKVRASVAKALLVCQSTSSLFDKKGGCVSCHGQLATGMAVRTAKPRGIQADYKLEADQAAGTYATCNLLQGSVALFQDPGGAIHTIQNYLIHGATSQAAPTLTTDSMVHYICAYQRKEGDWPLAGTVRPPLEDGSFTFTAEAVLALHLFPIPAMKKEIDRRIDAGVQWLRKTEPLTTEDRTMQILGLVWSGNRAPGNRVRQLASMQRIDGGWGQTTGLPSDAYATGEVLMALHEAGVKATDPTYTRGVQYLLRTQKSDGTWHVVTRSFTFQPYFESGFPYAQDQWISQQGTAYAAIALADAIEK